MFARHPGELAPLVTKSRQLATHRGGGSNVIVVQVEQQRTVRRSLEHLLQRGYSLAAWASLQPTQLLHIALTRHTVTVRRAFEARIVERHELAFGAQPEIDFNRHLYAVGSPHHCGAADRFAGIFCGFTRAACLGDQQKVRHDGESPPNLRRCR
jgi:hypothetical protein